MQRKVLSVVIDEESYHAFYEKFKEIQVYGSKKRYTKAQVGFMLEALLSKENLDKLDMESCFKK